MYGSLKIVCTHSRSTICWINMVHAIGCIESIILKATKLCSWRYSREMSLTRRRSKFQGSTRILRGTLRTSFGILVKRRKKSDWLLMKATSMTSFTARLSLFNLVLPTRFGNKLKDTEKIQRVA